MLLRNVTLSHLDRFDLDRYMVSNRDYIAGYLQANSNGLEKTLKSHEWLVNSSAKRLIYHQLYGDLIAKGGKKVLDVGGG